MNPQWRIELCFIEFADIMLDQGLNNAATGATQVIVVPLILNAAGHVKMEIPHHINKARERHTDVEFIYAPHLGANDSILCILKRNLTKVMAKMDMPDPKTTGVIILGRGASDRGANGEVAKMARWLYDETDHDQVDIAFTGITYPRIEAVVQKQITLGITQLVILPYYLFTGTLVERIMRQVIRIKQQYPLVSIQTAGYFGFEDEIYALLNQRVSEALAITDTTALIASARMMECDGCGYRELAEDHGHHHTHDQTPVHIKQDENLTEVSA